MSMTYTNVYMIENQYAMLYREVPFGLARRVAGEQHPSSSNSERLPSTHQGPEHPSRELRHRRGRSRQPGRFQASQGKRRPSDVFCVVWMYQFRKQQGGVGQAKYLFAP